MMRRAYLHVTHGGIGNWGCRGEVDSHSTDPTSFQCGCPTSRIQTCPVLLTSQHRTTCTTCTVRKYHLYTLALGMEAEMTFTDIFVSYAEIPASSCWHRSQSCGSITAIQLYQQPTSAQEEESSDSYVMEYLGFARCGRIEAYTVYWRKRNYAGFNLYNMRI